jgi:hypothetical protein
MAKVDQLVSSLQKLYAKRSSLDKQIVDGEKKLATEAKASAKPAVEKPAKARKSAKKSAAKSVAPKPLLKK